MIEAFNNLQQRDDFFLIIAGHGDGAYSRMLTSLAAPLIEQKKAMLHPYVRGERLRELYWLSDIFVSVAADEGGPVTVMEGMGCELPVLSTPVGETAEMMKKYNVGAFVSINSYNEWASAIESLLNNGLPKPLNRETARDAYHRENIARRFVSIYHELYKSHYLNS